MSLEKMEKMERRYVRDVFISLLCSLGTDCVVRSYVWKGIDTKNNLHVSDLIVVYKQLNMITSAL